MRVLTTRALDLIVLLHCRLLAHDLFVMGAELPKGNGPLSQNQPRMYCLSCTQHGEQAACPGCGADLGDPAEGLGFLPQLRALEGLLDQGAITPEVADLRLHRLEEALHTLVGKLDETSTAVWTMPIKDEQRWMMSGFLTPLREGLATIRAVVQELPLDTPWGEETWQRLFAAQRNVATGQRGLGQLSGT